MNNKLCTCSIHSMCVADYFIQGPSSFTETSAIDYMQLL